MPGVIDAHTHIGYGSERDLETETKNAVSGGVTSLITYHRKAENYLETVPAFIDKINREAFCNVGIHLGLSTYEQTDQLATYVNEFKIPSFKYFTNYIGAAGVKAGVEIVSDANLIEWMTRIARLGGTLCIHAENQDVIEKRTAIVKAKGEDNLQGWYEARPPICEAEAILRCAYFAAKTGCRFYAVHVTCAESLEVLRMMKRQYPDAQIIVETCPHYLTHTVDSEWGNVGKANPPLRKQSDVEALWAANPAEIFGMEGRGSVKVGAVADLTVVSLDQVKEVPVEFSNADYNIYQGKKMRGWPVYTFVNGCESRQALYQEKDPVPHGTYVPRTAAK